MSKYAINMKDGVVRIVTMIDATDITLELDKWGDKADVLGYMEISDDDIPDDRYFRGAWKFCDDNGIRICPDTAKSIKLDELRVIRAPLLEDLDTQFVRALENGASTSFIVAQKKALRDVTKVELPDDLDALKDFVPEILK